MIIIDTNALVVLLVGLIDVNQIGKHKRTSIYEKSDFDKLLNVVGDFRNLVTLPNIWTEVDNILNDFSGNYKYQYIQEITALIQATSEKYLESKIACTTMYFMELGLTDSLIIEHAQSCKLLITSDSKLSDYATATGITVYDLVKEKNLELR